MLQFCHVFTIFLHIFCCFTEINKKHVVTAVPATAATQWY